MARPEHTSLLRLLDKHAASRADDCAYIFLNDGTASEEYISYSRLRERALTIAARLAKSARPGDRALLLYPPGIEYIAAFLACLYARVIAVPAYPPQGKRSLPRLESIATDAAPAVALVDESVARRIKGMNDAPAFLGELSIIVTNHMSESPQNFACGCDQTTLGDIALLQYTSGSTGNPKGVILTHENLIFNQEMIRRAFGHSESTRVCSWLPPYHDMGLIGTILQPLYMGVLGVLMPPQLFLQKPVRWLAAISKYRATTSGAPNFAYELCTDRIGDHEMEGLDLSCWDLAFNGAEPVRPETMERFARRFVRWGFDRSAFYPCYGLAEATLLVTGGEKAEGPRLRHFKDTSEKRYAQVLPLASCGSAVGQELRIVDPDTLVPCMDGITGELWVRGDNVAVGYWGKPDLTAEVFRARLDGESSNEGTWLRTGDLGFIHEGNVFVAGRLKDLIIVRGLNHFPSDLERTAGTAHQDLLKGASAAFSVDVKGEERAVVVQEIERRSLFAAAEAAEAIREAIAERHALTLHEVVIVKQGTVPLTSSGKVQRHRCRQLYCEGKLNPVDASSMGQSTLEQPKLHATSPTEEAIARIWREQLSINTLLDANESFFRLGGDSLAATQVAFALQEAFNTALDPEILFKNRTIKELAQAIDELTAARSENFVPAPDPENSVRRSGRSLATESVHSQCESGMPMSHQQRRIWLISRLDPNSSDYNIPFVLRLRGMLVPNDLKRGLQIVAERHEIFNVIVSEDDGEPWMRVGGHLNLPVQCHDFSDLDQYQRGLEYERIKEANATTPFDIVAGPLWRSTIVTLGPEEHLLFLAVHHLISDGWSAAGWVDEVLKTTFDLQEPGRGRILSTSEQWSYREYVIWQQHRMRLYTYREKLDWWVHYLRGSKPLHLPQDWGVGAHPNRARMPCSTRLGSNELNGLKSIATSNETTIFVVLLTIFKILLRRLSGEDFISVGYPAANREHPRSRNSLGLYVNTLVARSEVSTEASFTGVLDSVKTGVLDGLSRQEISFDDILRELRMEKDCEPNPLFRVFFNLLSFPIPSLTAGRLDAELVEEPVWGNKFDLSLYARDSGNRLHLDLLYNPNLFGIPRAQAILRQFEFLVREVLADPNRPVGAYPLCAIEGGKFFANRVADIAGEPVDLRPVFLMFEEQACRNPDALALVDSEGEWSYRMLNERANRLAANLVSKGISKGDVVGILARRCAWLVCAIMGVHKAGAAFAILDTRYAAFRLRGFLETAHPRILLMLDRETRLSDEVSSYVSENRVEILDCFKAATVSSIERQSGCRAEVSIEVAPHDLAYVAFTSGTTGVPRGIEGTHAPLSYFVAWYGDELGLKEAAGKRKLRFAMLSGLAHDPLLRDFCVPLVYGHSVFVPSPELYDDPVRLGQWLASNQIEIAHLTPSLWDFISSSVKEDFRCERLSYVVFSGEALRARHARAVRKIAPNASIINGYGATETPQLASYQLIESIDQAVPELEILPFGKGARSTQIVLVNEQHMIAAPGELAEICVRSQFLARAYRQHSITKTIGEVLVLAGHEIGPVYRTGDFGRYDLDGNATFAKRKDRQISLNGFRVELGDIETCIRSHPLVADCAICSEQSALAQTAVTAYYISRSSLSELELLQHLNLRLPAHMIPARLFRIERLPLNPSGKVDFTSLPKIKLACEPKHERVEAKSETEAKLAEICSRILAVAEIRLDRSFLHLGGCSIEAVKFAIEVEREFGVRPDLREFLRGRSIASLALWIDNELWLRRKDRSECSSSSSRESSDRDTFVI